MTKANFWVIFLHISGILGKMTEDFLGKSYFGRQFCQKDVKWRNSYSEYTVTWQNSYAKYDEA